MAPLQRPKEKYFKETMVGFWKVSERDSLANKQVIVAPSLGFPAGGSTVSGRGFPASWAPSPLLVSRGVKDDSSECGLSATQGWGWPAAAAPQT